MQNRYKMIVSNQNIYREIEIPPEMTEFRIGTSLDCDIRLKRELFFAPIELNMQCVNCEWQLSCSDNLYITVGDVRKLLTKKLSHGDELLVKYQESDSDVLRLSFAIDFDYGDKNYDVEIDILGISRLKIGGGKDCDIAFSDPLLEDDSLELSRDGTGRLSVHDNDSKYGVFVNGSRICKTAIINDLDFFSIVDYGFFYKNGRLYTTSKDNMVINGLKSAYVESNSTHFKYPKFCRNTRVQYLLPEADIEIQPAAQKPTKSKKNIVMSLIPSLAMLAMTIVLRGIIGGGGTFVIYSAVSMTIGVVMSVVSFIQENKEYKQNCRERIDNYNRYLEGKKHAIEELRANELRVRNLIYESLDNSIDEVFHFGKRLFERNAGDKDFLQIYMGRGRVESANPVRYSKVEFVDLDDPLTSLPAEVAAEYTFIDDAPITSDFMSSCCVGIVGDYDSLRQMLTNITLDIGIRHFYNDVKMVYVFGDDFSAELQWLRWLHNVDNVKLDVRNIVCDEESKNLILEEIYIILSARENICEQHKDTAFSEQYVVFVTDSSIIRTHPVSKYFNSCAGLGFTFVFLEEYEENLPQGCDEIVRIRNNNTACIFKSGNGDAVFPFVFPTISDKTAEEVALRLGAVSVDEVSLEGELTKNISLYELLDILSAEDLDLGQRWGASLVYKSLSAPLGVKSKNQTVYLDISDKANAHGPHGLVAGTTGSGKSEVLQTYILSMATLYHPYEVGFVIIDFKGGGMANQFKDLPHLIGTVTNIDGREINRSLRSIKAELVKRQEVFAESGVNHINDYIKLYKAGKVAIPLPHLIIIVDEFAELKQEYPDFMQELISAARIGRTLGVHLILATQKPAGVVDAQIWSNSKFKLCLKVQTKEDSNEVIKTPLAAEIVEPGRAYFQVGNNEIFDLFQSAYSGASVPNGGAAGDRHYAIYEKNFWGKRTLRYTNRKPTESNDARTQLQGIVGYVSEYCKKNKIDRLPGICLPSLNDRISTDELSYSSDNIESIRVPIGLFDDPEHQRQGEMELDLSRDNVYIVGSSQMGKTVMLQTLIYGLIRKYTPQMVNMFLIDCGSMVLKIFEESCHVGGIVLTGEEEKCKNLFKLLNSVASQRKKTLSDNGVGNYAAYVEAGFADMPLIVVAIDNMAAFKEYFPEQYEEIEGLAREGQGVGISFVITAAMSNTLSYRGQANFGKKIVLNCNDSSEYSNVLGHCTITPKENAGRGLFVYEKRVLEFQTAIFGHSEKEAERNGELKEYIERRNNDCQTKAMQIPLIPDRLSLGSMMDEYPADFRKPGILPIGMDYETIALTSIDIKAQGSLALLGDSDSREHFVLNLLRMIAKTAVFHNIEAVVLDDKFKKMEECENFAFVRQYLSDTSDEMVAIDEFCDGISRRIDEEGAEHDMSMMLVINSGDLMKKICADRSLSKQLAAAVNDARDAGAFILFAAVENQTVGFNSPEILKTLKEERQAILFAMLSESKMFDVSGRIRKDVSRDSSIGYLFCGASYSRIKIFE